MFISRSLANPCPIRVHAAYMRFKEELDIAIENTHLIQKIVPNLMNTVRIYRIFQHIKGQREEDVSSS